MDRSDEYSADARDIVVNEAGHRDILDTDRGEVLADDPSRVAVATDADHQDDEPNDTEMRTGDVLGLGGSPVPKMPGDPSTDDDPEAASQRRARMREGEAEGVSDTTPSRSKGATGIDMGSGGTGTGLSGD